MGKRGKAPKTIDIPDNPRANTLSEQTQAEQIALIRALWAVINRIGGGGIKSLFEPVHDTRSAKKAEYPLPTLFFVALLMYICGLGARRNIKTSLNVPAVELKLKTLGSPGVPHGDTINDLFKDVSIDEVQKVILGAADRLLDSRVLESYRLKGVDYLVAIDGVWTKIFKEPHADNHLTQKHSDKSTTYYSMVLDVKLVTPHGLSIPLMTEFLENIDNASKQDCETKAFYRVAARLKQWFPRLSITLLLDGMFATGPVMDICDKNGWHYLTTLTDKDLPSVMEEMTALALMQSENHQSRTFTDGSDDIRQDVSWITGVSYADTKGNKHKVSVITCTETVTTLHRRPRLNKRTYTDDGQVIQPGPTVKVTKFQWITNYRVSSGTIWELATAARRRWKIEDSFNEQKNRGDLKMTHAYSYDPNADKVFYLVLQLAHLIMQLMYKSQLLDHTSASTERAGSLREVAKNMREAWRNVWLIKGLFDLPKRFHIRLRPPPIAPSD